MSSPYPPPSLNSWIPSMLENCNNNYRNSMSEGLLNASSIPLPPIIRLDDFISEADKYRLLPLIVDEGLQFVEAWEECLCSNCNLVAIFHQMFPCGHSYCRDCYKLFREKGRKCRKCRSEIVGSPEALRNEELEKALGHLVVVCPHRDVGCSQNIALGQLLGHLEACQFGPMTDVSSDGEVETVKRKLNELAGTNKRLAEDYDAVQRENKRLKSQQERTKLELDRANKSLSSLQGAATTNDGGNKPIVVFVRAVNGKRFPLKVLSGDTVDTIRALANEVERPSPARQQLVFKGKQLRDGRTLADYNVRHLSTLRAVMRHPEGSVVITVKIGLARVTTLAVELTDTVLVVKERIQAREGITVDRQGLKFNSVRLQDERRLCDYDFRSESVLYVAIRQHTQPVPVELLPGRTLLVNLFGSDTVRDVKTKLQEAEGVAADRQCVYHQAHFLLDDEILSDHLVPGTSCLNMLVREEDALCVKIQIRFGWLERSLPMWVAAAEKVSMLRAKIGLLVPNVPTADIRLSYNNEMLADVYTLADFGVPDDATVVVTTVPRAFD